MNPNAAKSRHMQGFALVDPENQTIWNGRRLPLSRASAVFDEIDRYIGGLPTTAALAPSLLGPYIPLLAPRGWGLEMVVPGPDAADLVLLEHARFAVERGYTDLVVVSGDHIFAELAHCVRLHVVSHRDRLSRALASAATSISYLTSGAETHLAA